MLLNEVEINKAKTAITSYKKATLIGFFDIVARACRKLACEVNANVNGVMFDRLLTKIDF